ncbi:MAG: alpha-L-fucosidase [Arcanobacterium sp.]|nr:alpha-L-fucosidase [Arcanobacterium sp.]
MVDMKSAEDTQIDFTPDALEAAGALHPSYDPGYVYPTDPVVARSLEHWQDLKLGVIIHWGIYTTIGQAGSWSLQRGHLGDFTDPPREFEGSDAEYHRWYYDQRHRFSAEDFDATQWADLCATAGMKYAVVTTKHHDGFALYDTAYSNLKVTAEDVLPGRDLYREMVDAFREAGLETGVYFSKADWARPEYWDLARPIADRFHNYSIEEDPERWERFINFSHGQIEELLKNYGPMNVLWLDAGWVRAPEEDFHIDAVARLARRIQPGILVVDREVHGEHENYRTPEQELPDRRLDYPWESCITWTKSWCSTRKDEPCKPTSEIVANLLRICARGGNYLVGFGPDATGALSVHVQSGLRELGAYMATHGAGIYGTRSLANPPDIEQLEGVAHEWFMVRKPARGSDGGTAPKVSAHVKASVHVEDGDRLFLYGVPQGGVCSPARLRVTGTYRDAINLGGGTARVSVYAAPSGMASSRTLAGSGIPYTTIDIAPGTDETDMGYVIELLR